MDVETFMEEFKNSLVLKTSDDDVSEGGNTPMSAETDGDVSENESQADTIDGSQTYDGGFGSTAKLVKIEDEYESAHEGYKSVDSNISSGDDDSQSVLGSSDDPSASGVTSYGSMESILYENEKKNSPYDTTGVDLLREIYFDLTNCGNNKTFARTPSSIRDGLLTIPDKTNNRYDLTSSFDDEKGERTRLLAAAVTNSYGNALKLTKLLVEVAKKRSITQRENIKVPKGYEGGLTIPNWIYSTMTVLKGTVIDSEVHEFLLKTQTENKKPDDDMGKVVDGGEYELPTTDDYNGIKMVDELMDDFRKDNMDTDTLKKVLAKIQSLRIDDFNIGRHNQTLLMAAAKRNASDQENTVQIVKAILGRIGKKNISYITQKNKENPPQSAQDIARKQENFKVVTELNVQGTVPNTQITSILSMYTTIAQIKDKIEKVLLKGQLAGIPTTTRGVKDIFTAKTRILYFASGNVFENYILKQLDEMLGESMTQQETRSENDTSKEKDLLQRIQMLPKELDTDFDIIQSEYFKQVLQKDGFFTRPSDRLSVLNKTVECRPDGLYTDHVVEVKTRFGSLKKESGNTSELDETFYVEENYIMQILVEMQVFEMKKAHFVNFYSMINWYSFIYYLWRQYTDDVISDKSVMYRPIFDTRQPIRTILENAAKAMDRQKKLLYKNVWRLLEFIISNDYTLSDEDKPAVFEYIENRGDKDKEYLYEVTLERVFRPDIDEIVGLFQSIPELASFTPREKNALEKHFNNANGTDFCRGILELNEVVVRWDVGKPEPYDTIIYKTGIKSVMKNIMGSVKRKDNDRWKPFEAALTSGSGDVRGTFISPSDFEGDDELIWHEFDLTGYQLYDKMLDIATRVLIDCQDEYNIQRDLTPKKRDALKKNVQLAQNEIDWIKARKEKTDFDICIDKLEMFYADITRCDLSTIKKEGNLPFHNQIMDKECFTRGKTLINERNKTSFRPLRLGKREHFILFLRLVGEQCSLVRRRMKRNIKDGEWREIEGENGNWDIPID